MPNILFSRKDSDVQLSIDALIPTYDERRFTFTFQCGTPTYAGLLSKHLQDRLGNLVEKARREAYEEGWKDAKAKRSKSNWFGRYL